MMKASFRRSHAHTAILSGPSPAAGHRQPTPLPETPGHSQACLGQSLVGSLLLYAVFWCTQGFSTENSIKGLLSMALAIRTRPSLTHNQSLPSGSFHKPLIILHQRADRLKTTITQLTNLIRRTTALYNSMKL